MELVELSFVIPAYNEEVLIETTLDALDNMVAPQKRQYEIIVVDDGSKDKTLANATRYAKMHRHVKVVSYRKNLGKGYAVKTGFMQCGGQIVIFADSDMEIDLGLISKYLAALEHGDIVIASKCHPDSRVEVSLSRRILSLGFNGLVRLLTGVPFKDTQSGLKAMRKSAFVNIFPRLAVKRYAFDVELLAVARLYGLTVVEMPVSIKIDASLKPKQIWKMFFDLLGIAYRLRLIHWYQRQIPIKNGLQNFASIVFREQ
jgi:glycosyltransferase involved in cell wall biosynthesis